MPPCRKICSGRLVPMPLSQPVATIGSACPAPAQPVTQCGCDEGESEPELTCDENTCANADDCKQLHPEICPHGLATDEDCPGCREPEQQQLSLQICPHCQSQIAMFDPKQRPAPPPQSQARKTSWPAQAKPPSSNTKAAAADKDGDCAVNCPTKKGKEAPKQSSDSNVDSCCGSSKLKLRSPHISQIKINEDLQCGPQSPRPVSPDSAKSCCMSASAIRCAPHMGKAPPSTEGMTCGGMGPKTCCEMDQKGAKGPMKKGQIGKAGQPATARKDQMSQTGAKKDGPVSRAGQPGQTGPMRQASQTNRTSQSAARPTGGVSGKGKAEDKNSAGNPNCPRSGAAATSALFPALAPPQPCLCRMPPAYNTGCTGNLSGNCNCTACNK